MTINIMNEYIQITKKQIDIYFKLVFEKEYNKNYVKTYTDTYINARYYNFFANGENRTIRKIILEELRKTEEYMVSVNLQDKELIEKMCVFFCYILYFDNVVYCKNLSEKIFQIAKLRKKVLMLENDDFEEELYRNIVGLNLEKDKLLEKFNSEEFFLKLSNYKENSNIYRVNLKHTIKFPMEYSEMAINKVFNTGIICEDKLVIEYYLIVIQIIKDIVRQNFRKQYIVEFSEKLLEKPKKIKSILNIIDNVAIQDKISLKIRYENFMDNREKIYELMRNGFRFSVILDNSFEANYKNMETLKMFKFVLISRESNQYTEIMKLNDEIKNNIIEI